VNRRLLIGLRIVCGAGVVALAAVLVWNLLHQDTKAAAKIAHGRIVAAPRFDLERLDAPGRLTVAALRGRVVVVNFWQSTCEPCKAEAPLIAAAIRRWRGKPVEVVGIDTSEPARSSARAFMRRYGLSYPVVFDPSGDVAGRYGVYGTPTTVFLDRRGRVIPPRVVGPLTRASLDGGIRRALAT
jgi:cytochrome c biogenesis protein CcmG, thiol:disulfide interchange protein DsbE